MNTDLAQRLRERADGFQCAADAEQIVMDGLLEFRQKFDEGDRSDFVMRRLRIRNDAKNNWINYSEQASDLREAADLLDQIWSPLA